MKAQLQLRQTAQLTLTPQLQQSIRLLQLSTLELEQEVETFLRTNPLIERVDASEDAGEGQPQATPDRLGDHGTADEFQVTTEAWSFEDAGPGSYAEGDGDEDLSDPKVMQTLRDHLFEQIRLLPLSERDVQLLVVLIDNLDEDGYLRCGFTELATETELDAESVDDIEWSVALRLLHSLEPVGVGARNLAECLNLQIMASEDLGREDKKLAGRLVQHLDLLAQRDYAKLKKIVGVGEDVLRRLHKGLQHLDPRPGAAFARADIRYVVPDVLVHRKGLGWGVMLNPDVIPRLRINGLYSRWLENGVHGPTLSAQLQEARWLIKNIEQRFDTILRVSRAVVERQRAFLEQGETAMRPLVLREIADELGLHESTISRVTTQKFLLTPRGLFELKYFFSSHVGTDSGEAASSTAIRALIRQLVAQEDSRNPLSDQRMADKLGEQGYKVARRTVAKYREALNIHSASMRKSL